MWERLSDIEDEALIRRFLSLAASVATFAGISSEERRQLCFASVTAQGGAHVSRFAEEVVHDLASNAEEAEETWAAWLGGHLADRMNGVPRDPEDSELAAWADAVPLLGARVPEGIVAFNGRVPGFNPDNPGIDIPTEALTTHGPSLVAFLAERVANSVPNDAMLAYQFSELVEDLGETLTAVELVPLVAAMRDKGYVITNG